MKCKIHAYSLKYETILKIMLLYPQKLKIFKKKIKRNEGFSFNVRFLNFFAGLPKSPKLWACSPKSLKIITSVPQLPENK